MKPEIKFGIYAGAGLILWTLFQYILKIHVVYFGLYIYNTPVIILILLLSLLGGLKEKRNDLGGHINLRSGVRSGIFQLFTTAFIASAFMFIYDYYINPLWVENLLQWEYSQGNRGIFVQLANEPFASSENVILSNTETHLCYYFLSILIIGGVIASAISLFLSNRTIPQPPAPPEMQDTAQLKNPNL